MTPSARLPREHLERMSKEELVSIADALGIDGARKFVRLELIDEILRAQGVDRGLLGRARDLLRNVVERGLGLAPGEHEGGGPEIERSGYPGLEVVLAGKPSHSAGVEGSVGPAATADAVAVPREVEDVGDRDVAADADAWPMVDDASLVEPRAAGDMAAAASMADQPAVVDEEALDDHATTLDNDAADEDSSNEGEGAVRSATLARIYLSQGHVDRARRILEDLLRERPDDEEALALHSALANPTASATLELSEPTRTTIESTKTTQIVGEPQASELTSLAHRRCHGVRSEDGCMYVQYRIGGSRDSASDANGRSPADATFVMRVVVVEPALTGPKVHTRDFELEDASASADDDSIDDEVLLEGLPRGSFVRVAVGFKTPLTFASQAHTWTEPPFGALPAVRSNALRLFWAADD